MKEKPKTIVIESPEHFELHFQLAGIGSRFLAYLVDKLVQIGLFTALVIVLLAALFLMASFDPVEAWTIQVKRFATQWGLALVILAYGVIVIGYFILFEYLWNGSTPGKRSQHIRVIRNDARPLTLVDSAIRNILRFVDIVAEVYPVGLVVMFLDSRNRRLGDLTAGTVVVMDGEVRAPSISQCPDLPAWDNQIRHLVHEMTPDDYRLITRFLSRRASLDPHHRDELAKDICMRVFRKTVNLAQQSLDPEMALEAAATIYRENHRVL